MRGYTKVLRSLWDGDRVKAIRPTEHLKRKEIVNHYCQLLVEFADHCWFPGLLVPRPFEPYEERYYLFRLNCTPEEWRETVEELKARDLILEANLDGKTYLYVADFAQQADRFKGGGKSDCETYKRVLAEMTRRDGRVYTALLRAFGINFKTGKREKCRSSGRVLGQTETTKSNSINEKAKVEHQVEHQVEDEYEVENEVENEVEDEYPHTDTDTDTDTDSREQAPLPPEGVNGKNPATASRDPNNTLQPKFEFPNSVKAELTIHWRTYHDQYHFNASQWATKALKADAPETAVVQALRRLITGKDIKDAWAYANKVVVEVTKDTRFEQELQQHQERKKEGFVKAGDILNQLLEQNSRSGDTQGEGT